MIDIVENATTSQLPLVMEVLCIHGDCGIRTWSGVLEDMYLLVAAGLPHAIADHADIPGDLFSARDYPGCTPQLLPVDVSSAHDRSQPELRDS